MTTGRKLTVAGVVIAGVTAYMAYVGASTSWQYYLSVDECVADAAKLPQGSIRVSGKVASDSLQIAKDRTRAEFVLQGETRRLAVTCTGPLPDNLSEGTEVVVEGRLETAALMRGDKVITRCASKYQSQTPATASPATASPGTVSSSSSSSGIAQSKVKGIR